MNAYSFSGFRRRLGIVWELLIPFNTASVDAGRLAFAQFFMTLFVVECLPAGGGDRLSFQVFGIPCCFAKELVHGESAAVDACCLAFAQFFHDFVYC
ncbi:MAG: hypothetical protein IPH31_04250 [Lewinellaceae bacterium]|nr:hypothetical protein [Lewinellaceae bacterium]